MSRKISPTIGIRKHVSTNVKFRLKPEDIREALSLYLDYPIPEGASLAIDGDFVYEDGITMEWSYTLEEFHSTEEPPTPVKPHPVEEEIPF